MTKQPHILKAILPLFLVIFIDGMGMGIIFPILTPIYMDHTQGILAHATPDSIRSILYGLTLCMFPLFMFIGTPILGDLSDRVGRKKVLLICLMGAFLAYGLSALAVVTSSVVLLVISRMIAGFTAGSQAIAQAAIIDVVPQDKKAFYIALLLLPACLGFIAGPLIGAYLADATLVSWFSLSVPLYFASILSLLNALLLIALFKETSHVAGKVSIKIFRGFELLVEAFRLPEVRGLAWVFLVMQLGWGSFFQYASPYLSRVWLYSNNSIGLYMALMGVGFAGACTFGVGILTKRFTMPKLVMGALAVSAVFIILTLMTQNPWVMWIVAAPLAFSMAIVYTVLLAMFSDMIGADRQGWIMGVTTALSGIGWAVVAMLDGFIESYSEYAPLTLAAVMMTLATAWMIRLNRKS